MPQVKYEIKNKSMKLLNDIRQIIAQARTLTRRSVNSLQVLSNYLIGEKACRGRAGWENTGRIWERNPETSFSGAYAGVRAGVFSDKS